jgi:myosin heavy subunit
MNQADTPNNGANFDPLESVNSPESEQASFPSYLVLPHENVTIGKLPLLTPGKNPECETELPPEDAPQRDWVAEPDREQQAIVDSEFNKLLGLNEELRCANNNLYSRVEELTAALSESETALQLHKKRLSVTESMLSQQNQELSAAQEQIQSLYEQLETAVQTVQHQEMSIESYKAQLELNQQRLAQLERDCALIQFNYHEQSHQLLQSENTCRELRTRLMRQQRQTLQFKAALEKCLETPFPNSLDETSNKTKCSKQANSLFPNAEPIRPWSAESELSTNDLEQFKGESLVSPSYQHDDNPTQENSSSVEPSEKEDSPQPAQAENSLEIINDCPNTLEAVLPLEPQNLEEQLDSVIELFFNPSASSPQPSQQEPLSDSALQDACSEENTVLQTELALHPQDTPVAKQTDEPIWEPCVSTIPDDEEAKNVTITLVDQKNEVTEDFWSEASQALPLNLSESTLLQQPFNSRYDDTSSPSPVIYPQRPPKKRKSLASVELPNFPQKVK